MLINGIGFGQEYNLPFIYHAQMLTPQKLDRGRLCFILAILINLILFIFFEEGTLEVTKGDQIIGQMQVGKAFGEMALLYNCNRTASVRGKVM